MTTSKAPLAIFLHGFGTSPTDLDGIAASFKQKGYEIISPCLQLHPVQNFDAIALEGFSIENATNNISSFMSEIDPEKYDTVLVGFSLGGAIATELASRHNLAGVLAINPFFEHTHKELATLGLWIAKFFPAILKFRRFQTTTTNSLKYLQHEASTLPLTPSKEVLLNSIKLKNNLDKTNCPILIIHSTGDKVASFRASVQAVKSAAKSNVRLVSIHGLNHFMQFDISPNAIRDLAINHFFTSQTEPEEDLTMLTSIYNEHQQESRHWSGIIFQLIIGFFTLFGALLAFTLPDVLQASWSEAAGKLAVKTLPAEEAIKYSKALAGTPYYLTSYSFLLSLYLTLLSLYFFYLNRIDCFIRLHCEPLFKGASWVDYRTNVKSSGRLSRIMTNAISVPIVLIPLLASIGLLTLIPTSYPDRIFSLESRNVFLQVFYAASIVVSAVSLLSLTALQLYTQRSVYGIPTPMQTTLTFESYLKRLYSSIHKGAYGPTSPRFQ